jgi:thiosulfate dehydrogenase [quinone] large subunit
MSHFLEHAQAIGALTVITELGIGLLVLLGLFTRVAALGGLVLNLVLFLSASWHVYPYFLGSDIVFVMCWLTLVATGPGGFCLDTVIQEPLRARLPQGLQRLILGPLPPVAPRAVQEVEAEPPRPSTQTLSLMTRWEALVAAAGTAILVILGLAPRNTALGSVAHGSTRVATPVRRTGGSSSPPAGTQKVGSLAQLPVNSALATTDPKSGDPAVVVHTSQSGVHAYDAVCTHAGCTVEYDPQYELLVCPCHGGAFDPAHGAQVVAGPPPQPLAELPITIGSNGDIYIA